MSLVELNTPGFPARLGYVPRGRTRGVEPYGGAQVPVVRNSVEEPRPFLRPQPPEGGPRAQGSGRLQNDLSARSTTSVTGSSRSLRSAQTGRKRPVRDMYSWYATPNSEAAQPPLFPWRR